MRELYFGLVFVLSILGMQAAAFAHLLGEADTVNRAEAAAPIVTFPPNQGQARMVVVRTIDGDTVVVAFLVGPESMRVAGIDCPEMDTEMGKTAKSFTEKLLPAGTLIDVDLRGRDKYGRLLGDVRLGKDRWLSNALLKAGLAAPYGK